MLAVSQLTRSHIREFLDDLGDWIAITRIDLESAPVDGLVEVRDCLHVLQLEEDWVLEALHQQVVVFLLHDVGVLSLHLLLLHFLKQCRALDGVLLLAGRALGLLLLAGSVDVGLVCCDLAFELVHVQLEFVDLLAQRLLLTPLHLLLLKVALLTELIDRHASLLELLLMGSLVLDLFHLQVALLGLQALLELLEVDSVVDNHLFDRRLLDIFFAELSLHVLEELRGHYLNISDFDGAHVHTPACDNFFHFANDGLAELLPVLDDVVDCRVGDLVAHDCAGHLLKDIVRLVEIS